MAGSTLVSESSLMELMATLQSTQSLNGELSPIVESIGSRYGVVIVVTLVVGVPAAAIAAALL